MLGVMAWYLAAERNAFYGHDFAKRFPPAPRKVIWERPEGNPVSMEYYAILDRIARGEKP